VRIGDLALPVAGRQSLDPLSQVGDLPGMCRGDVRPLARIVEQVEPGISQMSADRAVRDPARLP
jgi:hypothetical protein